MSFSSGDCDGYFMSLRNVQNIKLIEYLSKNTVF